MTVQALERKIAPLYGGPEGLAGFLSSPGCTVVTNGFLTEEVAQEYTEKLHGA